VQVRPCKFRASDEIASQMPLSCYRARYYDPGIGRFIREDPIGFASGSNFFVYVRNNPILLIDPTGLQLILLKPDRTLNTIVCDGKGRIDVQLGNVGSPLERKCLENCYRVHEESHIKDAMQHKDSSTICKGQAPGVRVGFADLQEQNASEVAAYDAEIKCLKEAQKHECPGCFRIILDAISDAEDHRADFQSKIKKPD